MNTLVKNLLAGSVLAAVTVVGAVMADDDVHKHKVIEIKAHKGDVDSDVRIMVEQDGVSDTVTVTQEELDNPDLLEAKLAQFDETTRNTVRQALENIVMVKQGDHHGFGFGDGHKVMIMNKGEGSKVKIIRGHDENMEFEFNTDDGSHQFEEHVMFGGDGVIKGHTSAIVQLIKRGEFSQEELDEIQAAVDQKR